MPHNFRELPRSEPDTSHNEHVKLTSLPDKEQRRFCDPHDTYGYSKGGETTQDHETILKLQAQKHQKDFRMKASGGWHSSDPELPNSPSEKLPGGTPEEAQHFRENYLTDAENTSRKVYRNGLKNPSIDNKELKRSNDEGHKYFRIDDFIRENGLDRIIPYIRDSYPEEEDRIVAYIQTRMNLNSQAGASNAETSSHADQLDFNRIDRDERVYMLIDRLAERSGQKDDRRSKEFQDIRGFMRSRSENKMTAKEYDKFLDCLKKNYKHLDSKTKHNIQQAGLRTYKQR